MALCHDIWIRHNRRSPRPTLWAEIRMTKLPIKRLVIEVSKIFYVSFIVYNKSIFFRESKFVAELGGQVKGMELHYV